MTRESFVLEYSEKINKTILVNYVLRPLAGLIILLSIIAIIFRAYEFHEFIVLSLFLIGGLFLGQILYMLPNYVRNRKDFRDKIITVEEEGITVIDHKLNRETVFLLNEIKEYTVISFSFSTYRVILLELDKARNLSISNSMSNYHLLERKLKACENLPRKRKFMPIGPHLEDVY